MKNLRPTDPLRQAVRRRVETDRARGPRGHLFPVHIYAYFDTDGSPLYVGQSRDLLTRHGAHRQRSAWFWEAAEFRVLASTVDRAEARRIEATKIRALRPRHNVYHNQVRDPRPSAISGHIDKRQKVSA